MLIFIDESGDTGFKTKKGSSKTFTVALVIFDDDLDAEEAALTIKKFRREIGKPDYFEFKFSKCSKKIKIDYFQRIKKLKFRVRAIVIKKDAIYSPALRTSKEKFYSYVIKSVLKNDNNTIKDARIRLDGQGERLFRKSLKTYLRKQLNSGDKTTFKNLRFRDSHRDVLIQLADMVVGAISRSYNETKSDQKTYIDIIKERIEDVWEFK